MKQFNSFELDWDKFSEQYKSRYKEKHAEESRYRLNYLLNYELLAYVPEPLEDEFYKAMPLKVETISTATLLMEIKKITVMEAVEHAQQSVVQGAKIPGTEPVQSTVGDDVVKAVVKIQQSRVLKVT